MHDILDALGEASLDLNVHLHIDCLCGLRVDLETPDEDLGFVCGGAYKELVIRAGLVADDHGRWVDEVEDLGDALLRAWMSIENLFDRRLVLVRIDVPDLKFAVKSTYKEMLFIDLVEESGILMVIDLVANALTSCLDINIADQSLLVVEA